MSELSVTKQVGRRSGASKRRVSLLTVLPAAVVAIAAVGGLLLSGAPSTASSARTSVPPPAGRGATHRTGTRLAATGARPSTSGPRLAAAGARPSTSRLPVSTESQQASDITPGRTLFEQNCASCHGPGAQGSAVAPNLVGLGAGTVDLWVSTGLMPLTNPTAQPLPKPSRFTRAQSRQIAAFVASLSVANGPGILNVDTKTASLSQGMSLFVLNCASCHTITGSGDALASGAYALSLHSVDSTQVAEAVRTGPGNMPRFGPGNITDQQLADIAAYIHGPIQHPDNRGGLGLGGIGPVAEGFVALLFGVGGLMAVAYWLGDRS